jgi:hypothetical protein
VPLSENRAVFFRRMKCIDLSTGFKMGKAKNAQCESEGQAVIAVSSRNKQVSRIVK